MDLPLVTYCMTCYINFIKGPINVGYNRGAIENAALNGFAVLQKHYCAVKK
jgi:hypothetical protein